MTGGYCLTFRGRPWHVVGINRGKTGELSPPLWSSVRVVMLASLPRGCDTSSCPSNPAPTPTPTPTWCLFHSNSAVSGPFRRRFARVGPRPGLSWSAPAAGLELELELECEGNLAAVGLSALATDPVPIAIEAVDIGAYHANRTPHVRRAVAGSTQTVDVAGDWNTGVVVRVATFARLRCGRRNDATPHVHRASLLACETRHSLTHLSSLALVPRARCSRPMRRTAESQASKHAYKNDDRGRSPFDAWSLTEIGLRRLIEMRLPLAVSTLRWPKLRPSPQMCFHRGQTRASATTSTRSGR